MDSGRHDAEWDGRDDHGQFVPAGAYMVKVEAAGENGTLYRASERTVVPR
jgi:flagellar hook assembly protein FlgD